MTLATDSLRRAAILVAALDTDSADRMLDVLSPEDAAQVRQMIIALGDIAAADEQSIINEFLSGRFSGDLGVSARPQEADVELYLSAEASAVDAELESTSNATVDLSRSEPEPSLTFLEQIEAAGLVQALAAERPPTIAVVLSRLSESRALEVLGALPDSLQGEVLRRWIGLGEADPAVLHEIQQGLLARLSPGLGVGRRTTGKAQIASVVQAAAPHLKQQILSQLALCDAALAEKVTTPRLAFDDLEYLNDAGLASMLRAADPQVIVLALAGAAESFVERVARQLPVDEARHLRHAMETLGPIRLADVEAAQQELARLTETLVHESSVTLSSLPLGVAA